MDRNSKIGKIKQKLLDVIVDEKYIDSDVGMNV